MSYYPVSPRHSPASVLQLGVAWQWKSGTTEVEFRYAPTGNRWCLVHGAGSDIYSPAGLPANFNQYYGVHYLNGGSVRAVHE